jgi:hypothetical protein
MERIRMLRFRLKFGMCFRKYGKLAGILIVCLAASALSQQRQAKHTVVNPVVDSKHRSTLRLDGDWDFAIDPKGKGEDEKWFLPDKAWPDQITMPVPGCWEAQGLGGPGWSSPSPIRVFEAINRKLKGTYTGCGWYRKTLKMPRKWKGKQVWLKIGSVNAQGWFWLNGQFVGHLYEYCGAHKFDVTDIAEPGKTNTVVALVRNDIPSRKGESQSLRIFGGLDRSVELEATSKVHLDNVYTIGMLDESKVRVIANVAGDYDGGNYELKVKVTGPANYFQPRTYRLTDDGSIIPKNKAAGKGSKALKLDKKSKTPVEVELDISLDPFAPWSPESPNLYLAEIVLLRNGKPIDGWNERFGVKKVESKDGKILLNNRPYFIRGAGDDHVYAMTICSPTDRKIHRKHLQIARDYGVNYLRHHTHTELPEFYTVADELGIMIQAELPYWGMNSQLTHMSRGDIRPQEELIDLIHHYRRYISLMTYCFGNEGNMADPNYKTPPESVAQYFDLDNLPSLDIQLYQLVKKLDPGRLVINNDGVTNHGTNQTRENSDIHQSNSHKRHVPGQYGIADPYDWPHLNHEYISCSVQEDPRLAPKYTGGFLPNLTVEGVKKQLAEKGIAWDLVAATLDAGYRLQAIQHKLGIESARVDPHNDGYIIWLLLDISPNSQNGILDTFYEPKIVPASVFRQYNGPTALLARGLLDAPIYSSGDQFKFEWVLSHFDKRPLDNCRLKWTLVDGRRTLANGQTEVKRIPAGTFAELAKVDIIVPSIAKPAKARLTANISGTDISNSYDVWLFPQRKAFDSRGSKLAGICVSSDVYSKLKQRYPDMVEDTDSAVQKADVILVDQVTESIMDLLNKGKTVITVKPSLGLGQKADVNLVSQPAESVIDFLNKDNTVITVFGPKQISDGILVDKLTETVIDLLNKGNTVVTANPYLELNWHRPGNTLGWWVRSNQSGSAIIRPEAFGQFPHSGVLDQLMFGVARDALIWQDGLRNVEPIMFGSGGGGTTYEDLSRVPNYFMYGFQARVGSGKLLLSGFDFMADRPESIRLLDEFIRYASSDSFQPKGTFDPYATTMKLEINGWSKTTEAPEKTDYYSFIGQLPLNLVRQKDGKKPLRWLTAAVADDVKNTDRFVFRFFAITGYESDPAGGKFSLYLSDPEKPQDEPKHLLDFDHTMKSAKWSGMEGRVNLDYEVLGNRAGQDSSGIMELSLTASLLAPGKPVELKVVGSSSDSGRFFGVYTVSLILFQDGKMNKKQ